MDNHYIRYCKQSRIQVIVKGEMRNHLTVPSENKVYINNIVSFATTKSKIGGIVKIFGGK